MEGGAAPVWLSDKWKDYELIDCGRGEKLERWGDQLLVRPDPQAIWNTPRTHRGWKANAGRYARSSTGGGQWQNKSMPERWTVSYRDLTFNIKPMNFKHTGLFPEQAANWDYIREIKQTVSIPVIANGDVFNAREAVHILSYTGADMAMIGRACFGNPWIFRQSAAALAGEPIPDLPPLAQRCDVAVRQFELARAHKGEKIACLEARKHYAWYLKGVPHSGYWKEQICQISTREDIYRITAGIKRELR